MDPIRLNSRATAQVQEMVAALERDQQQLNTYVAALMAGLDVPDGWRLDVRTMTFAPPATQQAQEAGGE